LVENSHNSVGTVSAIGTTACSGGITGYLNGGTITSSYNTGDVTIPASSLSYAGGIAGNIAVYTGVGGTIGGTIENNNNSGKVTAASTAASANLDAHSGGIAGYVGSSGVIRHSSNSGDVSSTSNGTFSLSHAGGIAGRILGTIENDNNTGKVTAKSDNTNAYSGGIVGYVSGGGSVKNAHNYDNVSATVTSSGNAYAGGIAGYMTGGGSVANSHNTDNISATASVDGQSFAGGIAGLVSGALAEIKTSYNNGEIYAVSSSLSASGGIVGKTENGGGTSLISNCYNTNYIYASASKVGSGESFAGGIVGGLWNSKIEKSYNIGNIETSTSDWNPRGGGIVADAPSSFIEYCAAINQKIKSGSMGRIFVYPDRILPNNFAYEGMEAVDSSFNGGIYKDGENKSLTDLQTQSTYKDAVGFGGLGWEFGNDDDHPWKMPLPGSAYLYPILYWQE
jgi:hypothetical protein